MSNPPNNSPEFWVKRAEELRQHAHEMKDPALKREVEEIAEAYERLAAQVASRRPKIMKHAAHNRLSGKTSVLP